MRNAYGFYEIERPQLFDWAYQVTPFCWVTFYQFG